MKILAVLPDNWHSSLYFFRVLEEMRQMGITVDRVDQPNYIKKDQSGYDVLIYNSFPDESNPRRFLHEYVDPCDEKYHAFKGTKILFDTHDNGTKDGFVRFSDWAAPRIKLNPSYEMLRRMNIIATIPFWVITENIKPQEARPITVLCAMRERNMPYVRKMIKKQIQSFKPVTEWLFLKEHLERLGSVLINIVPNGQGDSPRSCADTLAAGALLMTEPSVQKIKLLPYADLVNKEDFFTFTMDDVCATLDYLLENPKETDRIRESGHEKFKIGYDVQRSAEELTDWLNNYA